MHNYDLMAFSETWPNSADENDPHIISLLPNGYSMQNVDRNSRKRCGGVALVYKQSISVKCKNVKKYDRFKYMMFSLSLKHKSIAVVIFYKSPLSQDNDLTIVTFMSKFSKLLSQCVITTNELIIIRDINIHFDTSDSTHTLKFIELLQTNRLQKHVKDPTHYLGHALEVVISRDTSDVVCNVKVTDIGLSDNKGNVIQDHFAAMFNVKQVAPLLVKTVVQY